MDDILVSALTEANEAIDYMPLLEQIARNTSLIADGIVWIQGFALCAIVVMVLCFCYRFLRIFF